MKIPVFSVGIGEVNKKDVKKACTMKEKSHAEYAVILAFDVSVSKEATAQATHDGVQIMCADIIYNLQEKFKAYMEKFQKEQQTLMRDQAVFPVILRVDKQCIIRKNDPIIVGCDVLHGTLHIGTPLCVPDKQNLEIGRVIGIERDKNPLKTAKPGTQVCVKIE